jgi:hypothetical protein
MGKKTQKTKKKKHALKQKHNCFFMLHERETKEKFLNWPMCALMHHKSPGFLLV